MFVRVVCKILNDVVWCFCVCAVLCVWLRLYVEVLCDGVWVLLCVCCCSLCVWFV